MTVNFLDLKEFFLRQPQYLIINKNSLLGSSCVFLTSVLL